MRDEGPVQILARRGRSRSDRIADIREQKDKWQSRAERISLVSPC
jgi:hypothetical protein